MLEGISGNAGRAYRYLLAVVDASASDVAAERRADRYAAVPPAVSLQPRLLAREDELRRARVAGDELQRRVLKQDERFRELVRDKTKPNYENRVYPGVPMRLAIADQQTAILSIRPADDTATALHVNAPSLVLALCTYFETIWAAAAPMLLARGSSEELGAGRRARRRDR